MKVEAAQLIDWMPVRCYFGPQSQPMLDWCYPGERRFTDPFFEQTIEQCLRHPFNLLFRHQTPIEVLAEMYEAQPGIYPTGFIFHMSRCGSTLISQMLAALPQNIVISEAVTIDSILRANFLNPAITDAMQLDWLRWMISALGRRRQDQEQHLFIKFDSWHTLSMRLIRRAFPDVPWIFVYRDPVEVIVSQLRVPSGRMLSGMYETHLLGLDFPTVAQMQLEEYCAMVTARICETALQQHGEGAGTIISYRQLPEAVYSLLTDVFHLSYSEVDLNRMRDVAQLNAKEPSARFVDDTEAKGREATEAVRQMTGKWVGSLYEQLEAQRHA